MTASSIPVTLASQVRQSDEVLMQEVGDEVVLLDLASERYFGLDPVGARIWSLISAEPLLGKVHAELCEQFEAESDLIRDDLLALIRQLADAGLVKVD